LIIKEISKNIKKYSPNSFIIVITNPLDLMVYSAYQFIDCDKRMIVGMAGALDGARFSFQVAKYLGIGTQKVNSMVIGAHNDSMVVLPRYSSASGIPISELVLNGTIPKKDLDEMIRKTKTGGIEIVNFLGNGSAAFNPAICAASLAHSYIMNEKTIYSCSVLLDGEYGFQDVFAGAPVIIGENGVERIIELNLNKNEKQEFDNSVNDIKKEILNLNHFFHTS